MWHKNEGPKPTGRDVIIKHASGSRTIAEYDRGDWWAHGGAIKIPDYAVTHWHEIPPFEEAEHGCPTKT